MEQATVIRGRQPDRHLTINWRGVRLTLFAVVVAAVMTLGGFSSLEDDALSARPERHTVPACQGIPDTSPRKIAEFS